MKKTSQIKAAENMDWQQVVLNGAPPCFHLEGERFCGRAQRWDGHNKPGAIHKFISFADLLAAISNDSIHPATESKEKRLYCALKRISSYDSPERVRKDSESMGLGEHEAVSMAYENVIAEAKSAIHGMRRPK